MFANWVQMTSSTGGTGTLTLTAVTGAPSVTSVFGSSGTQDISYTIQEWTASARTGPPAKAEVGIGSVALATGVLTRTKPISTWNGTTYTRVSAAKLSFGTDTAKVRITVSPVGEIRPTTCPFVANTSPSLSLGLSHHAAVYTAMTTSYASGLVAWYPFKWRGIGTIDQVGINVSTAGGNVKSGLYLPQSSGLPGLRLHDWGGTPFDATTTGVKTVSVTPFQLAPGWYYSALHVSSTPLIGSFDARAFTSPLGGMTNGQAMDGVYRTGIAYATGLPADATGGSFTGFLNEGRVALYFRVSNS